MISVVEEENGVLARGIPASLSIFTGRKNELADELDRWGKDMAAHQRVVASADAKLRQRFMDAVKQLRAAMDENVERLRAAMDASRRRIDAVMNAVRNEISVDLLIWGERPGQRASLLPDRRRYGRSHLSSYLRRHRSTRHVDHDCQEHRLQRPDDHAGPDEGDVVQHRERRYRRIHEKDRKPGRDRARRRRTGTTIVGISST